MTVHYLVQNTRVKVIRLVIVGAGEELDAPLEFGVTGRGGTIELVLTVGIVGVIDILAADIGLAGVLAHLPGISGREVGNIAAGVVGYLNDTVPGRRDLRSARRIIGGIVIGGCL